MSASDTEECIRCGNLHTKPAAPRSLRECVGHAWAPKAFRGASKVFHGISGASDRGFLTILGGCKSRRAKTRTATTMMTMRSRLSAGHYLSRSGRPLPRGRGQAPGAALSPLGERARGRQVQFKVGIELGGSCQASWLDAMRGILLSSQNFTVFPLRAPPGHFLAARLFTCCFLSQNPYVLKPVFIFREKRSF